MTKQRLESFSDGVFAIVIALLILDVRVPSGALTLPALRAMAPSALAFVYAAAIALGFVRPAASLVLFALVPAFFILPHPWLDRWMAEADREG